MALQEAKVSMIGQFNIFFVTAGAADLPAAADFFDIGDWVINLSPSIASGDPAAWVCTGLGAANNAPTFNAIAYSTPQALTRTATASTTVTTADRTVLAGAGTVTLPAATAWPANVSVTIKATASSVTITPVSGQINGATSQTLAAQAFSRVIATGGAYYQVG